MEAEEGDGKTPRKRKSKKRKVEEEKGEKNGRRRDADGRSVDR